MKGKEMGRRKQGEMASGGKGRNKDYCPLVKEMLGHSQCSRKTQNHRIPNPPRKQITFEPPHSKQKEKEREMKMADLQRMRIEKQKQILLSDEKHLRRQQPMKYSGKKFHYNLDEILNEAELNVTLERRQFPGGLNQRQQKNDRDREKQFRDSFIGYITDNQIPNERGVELTIPRYQKFEEEKKSNKNVLRQKQVDEIRMRNKTCYSQFSGNKRDGGPSLDQIRKKYGYHKHLEEKENLRNRDMEQKSNKDQNEGEKCQQQRVNERFEERENRRKERSSHLLSYQDFSKTHEAERKRENSKNHLLSQKIDFCQREERPQYYERIKNYRQNYQESLKQKQAEKVLSNQQKHKYEQLKEKYSPFPQYSNPNPTRQANENPTSFHNKPFLPRPPQRERIKTYDGFTRQPEHSLSSSHPNPTSQDYQQVHRTLQTTADWMKKSICDLDAKINERLSRIIPDNRYHYKEPR